MAHRLTRLSPSRPGLARAGCRGFCSRSPSPSPRAAEGASERPRRPGLGKLRGGCGSPTPPISRTYTKGRRRNVQSLCAEGGARPSQGSRSEGRREQPGRGRRRRPGREAAVGLRREGEMRRKRQREAGDGEQRDPDSSSPEPERKGKVTIKIWGQDPGTPRFRFPHVLPPPPHQDGSRLPRFSAPGREARTESGSELRLAFPPRPALALTWAPDAQPAPSPRAGARVPGAGQGRRRGCAGRPQAGGFGRRQERIPLDCPRLLRIRCKTW